MLRNLAAAWIVATFLFFVVPQSTFGQVQTALQKATAEAMAGQAGSAVVLDVHSGKVLASYRLNVAARRLVPPGSAIKPFTLMALLKAGVVNEHTALMCKRSVEIAGHKLDCTHPQTSQPLDPAAALAYSCNSYFTTVATRLTPPQLRDSFLRDGFASVTGLAREEASGAVALAATPEQLQLQAIGEWGITITPLELAFAYRNLALLKLNHTQDLDPLFDGLQQSVSYGMANAAQPLVAFKVAGKTGTANASEGAWTHAWFAGYAPSDNPEIAVVVFLEKGHGGSEAAGVARQIFAAFAEAAPAVGKSASGATP